MLPFRIELVPGVPVYEQLVAAVTRAVVSGDLSPGDAFPSVRALSVVAMCTDAAVTFEPVTLSAASDSSTSP